MLRMTIIAIVASMRRFCLSLRTAWAKRQIRYSDVSIFQGRTCLAKVIFISSSSQISILWNCEYGLLKKNISCHRTHSPAAVLFFLGRPFPRSFALCIDSQSLASNSKAKQDVHLNCLLSVILSLVKRGQTKRLVSIL